MNETQITPTERDGELLRTLARQTGESDGEIVHQALRTFRDQLVCESESRRALLGLAVGIWQDRNDVPTLGELRGQMNRIIPVKRGE